MPAPSAHVPTPVAWCKRTPTRYTRLVRTHSDAAIRRAFYTKPIVTFLSQGTAEILGELAQGSPFSDEQTQKSAWQEQIEILRAALARHREGTLHLEFVIPRVGSRADTIIILRHVIFVIEFKCGEADFPLKALNQVWDYALDLKNFHEASHDKRIAPVLVATKAGRQHIHPRSPEHGDDVLAPIRAAPGDLPGVLDKVLGMPPDAKAIDASAWQAGRYKPTPSIIEAAVAMYREHSVADISRRDAGAKNLAETAGALDRIIVATRNDTHKSICFVTGVPGAGKTLVGLDVATRHSDKDSDLHSVYLSGNGPLVAILREALARDRVQQKRAQGKDLTKSEARRDVKAVLQPVHHFRDDCIQDPRPPSEHVVLFDEAQRAWNRAQTASFMSRKRKQHGFKQSEPEFLISCMDRHRDWAVIVCLVGGGQEINTGEAGIAEWLHAVCASFSSWHVHISPRLHDAEYSSAGALQALSAHPHVHENESLHLAVSMRSFRAEHVSTFVRALLDHDAAEASRHYAGFAARYPIALTRDVNKARAWLRSRARGSQRYGMVVSSQAQRLKPHAIDVRAPLNPVHWFLASSDDVRSSYYLEDAATEFDVQGLELDWTAVVWDGDFREAGGAWEHFSFKGKRWRRVLQSDRRLYLKNAYRVLLTRARQGMILVVPEGDSNDPTRASEYYDSTFKYLRDIGLPVI